MNKKILILAILGLMTPLVANAWFNSFGTAGGVDQVIKKGQESGQISAQPGQPGGGDGDGNEPGALTISNVSYTLKDAGDYYWIDVSFNTNKSVTKIEVNWYRADGWNFSKHKNTSGTSHILPIKYLKPNTTTYFVIKAYTATENVQSAQYSVAVSNGDSKVYDVYINVSGSSVRLSWRYFVANPQSNFESWYRKNGGSWYSRSITRIGQKYYWTNYADIGWQAGDQMDIQIFNPADRSETNIEDTILYGNIYF